MNEAVKEALLKSADDMKVSCSRAREIAEALGVPYREVGDAADELGIKITNCALGCF